MATGHGYQGTNDAGINHRHMATLQHLSAMPIYGLQRFKREKMMIEIQLSTGQGNKFRRHIHIRLNYMKNMKTRLTSI